ncbi:MAG: hypothetical protein AAF513_02645 [Pseudomonadota bacterium]
MNNWQLTFTTEARAVTLLGCAVACVPVMSSVVYSGGLQGDLSRDIGKDFVAHRWKGSNG